MSKRPVLRFNEYTEDWNQLKLGGVVDVCSGKDYKHLQPGDIPVYGTGGYMLSVNEALSYNEDAIGIGRKGTIDKPYLLKAPFWTVDTLFYAVVKCGFDLDFVYDVFQTIDWKKKDESTGVPSLSKVAINDADVAIPKYDEQLLIGRFFKRIDSLITLQQYKCDKLLTYKKAMLEKMFPKDGADVPEVRFAGYTKPWIKRKLLDNIQKVIDFRGRTPKKLGMEWSSQGYLALSALNVKDGYIDFSQDVHYGDQQLYDKWMSGNDLHKGQVVFTTEAPMGNVAQIPDERRYILSQRTIAFEVIPTLITEGFLATLLRTPVMFNKLTALSSGGTAKGVSQRSLAAVDTMVSEDLNEQELIAKFFSHLDDLLRYQLNKVESLQKIKKSFLDRMFI